MEPVNRSCKEVFSHSCQTEQTVDGWILNADAERRFHYRSDENSIDQLLEVMVTNSFIFGEMEEEEWTEEVD